MDVAGNVTMLTVDNYCNMTRLLTKILFHILSLNLFFDNFINIPPAFQSLLFLLSLISSQVVNLFQQLLFSHLALICFMVNRVVNMCLLGPRVYLPFGVCGTHQWVYNRMEQLFLPHNTLVVNCSAREYMALWSMPLIHEKLLIG